MFEQKKLDLHHNEFVRRVKGNDITLHTVVVPIVVNFNGAVWDAQSVIALADALQFSTSIQTLDVEPSARFWNERLKNKVSNLEVFNSVARAIENNNTITRLVLARFSGCISDKGAMTLAASLRTNSVIEELQLHENAIGDRGVAAIADVLTANHALRRLNLANNMIVDVGACRIAAMLRKNTTLTDLNLDGKDQQRWCCGHCHCSEGKAQTSNAALELEQY
uniref:Uncharacterized protein n=1 Tax=Odontella aurita TaxID=265563 RepID=A0A7S4JLB7_9STRA|mmetsp:Transcript_48578/g.146510  ORF Transcript_48578/g.146510 Transcript_48578/m.146510 type:complete len:222 (+) Transcript_48578:259-924(+)